MSTDERLDYLERQLTDIADYVVRQHEPPRRQKRGNPLVTAFLVLFLIALAGLVALNYAAAFGLFVPPGWQQAEQPQPLPTAIVRIPTAPARPVVVPASVPQAEPQPVTLAAPAPVPAPQPVEAIHPDAVPDQIGVNADLAAGGSGDTSPLPAVLPTVVPGVPVSPYNPADATAVADWEKALKNSGVDVDATTVACNADLAAGGMGCQP